MTTYEEARDSLRQAELDLMLERERVAELRRSLPPGPIVKDYTFGSPDGDVRLSELFSAPDRPVVLYHFMYGKAQTAPCPMCAMWADGWAAVDHHIAHNVDFAMVSAAPIDETLALAHERGWGNLLWLSAADNMFKTDIGGEDDNGNQMPFMSAYESTDSGPRLSWSGGAHIADNHWRGVDLFSPVWHFLDITRQGRGDWMPGLSYPTPTAP